MLLLFKVGITFFLVGLIFGAMCYIADKETPAAVFGVMFVLGIIMLLALGLWTIWLL